MRNLKKLLAVVVAICVLATFTVPAFAADTATTATTAAAKTDADICKELGVVKGTGTDGVTADYLATQPDRVQAAIMFLRLKGLEDTAKAFTGTDNFSDVGTLNDTNKAILAYLKANPDLGFEGVGDNKFDIVTKMTAKAYYKVMLVALGYTYGTDFTWENVFAFAASKGLTGLIDNTTFTVNDLCKGTVEALKATVKGGTDTLISKLVDGGSITATAAAASGLYSATAKALEVVSVKADNLKTVKFVFNKELNDDTVVETNFETEHEIFEDAILLDDKKTVVAVIKAGLGDDQPDQSDDVDVTVKDVKATDGTIITEVKKTVTFSDTTIPAITGVTVKNPKTLVIAASEPMNYVVDINDTIDEVKVDGNAHIGTSSVDFGKNTITVKFAEAMATGTRKIEISGIKDYANLTAPATSFNVEVVEDKTAPSIVSGKMNTTDEIEVTFNEDLDTIGDFTVDGEDATVDPAAKSGDSSVKLTLKKSLNVGATIQIKVGYEHQTDVMGNEVKDVTYFTFTVKDDTTLPTVTASIASDNDITLNFSEPMAAEGIIKILDADDDDKKLATVTVKKDTFKTDSDYSVIELAADTQTNLDEVDATSIKVVLEDMKDGSVRHNDMGDITKDLEANDTKVPEVIKFFSITDATDPDDDSVTIFFNEAMDSDSLKVLSNYIYDTTTGGVKVSKPLTTYTDAKIKAVATDKKSVEITMPGFAALAAAKDYEFTVCALKDKAGNTVAYTTGIQGPNKLVAFTIDKVEATEQNKVEVTFSRDIGTAGTNAFYVQTAATDKIKTGFKAVSIDDKVVTFTASSKMGTTVASLELFMNDATQIKDAYGNKLSAAGYSKTSTLPTLEDGIAPEVDEITDTGDTTEGAIAITFTEDVEFASVATTGAAAKAALDTQIILRDAVAGARVAFGSEEVDNTVVTVTFVRDGVEVGTLGSITSAVTFDKIVISNLKVGEDYSVQVVDGTALIDASTNTLAKKDETKIVTYEK